MSLTARHRHAARKLALRFAPDSPCARPPFGAPKPVLSEADGLGDAKRPGGEAIRKQEQSP
jgi:hypothetical protein